VPTSQNTDPARDAGRRLTALHRRGGWAARLSLLLPMLSGALLPLQAWVLASVLHAAIIDRTPLSALILAISGILALVAVRAFIATIGESLAVVASEATKAQFRRQVFGAMLVRLPVWTAAQSSGALSSLVIEQVEAFDGFLVRYMPAMLQAAILPIAFACVILPVDWMVALLFLVTTPLIPVFMMLAGWGAEAASRAQAAALARLTGRFADRLRGMVTLKLFGREAAEIAGVFEASEELRRRSMKVMRVAFLSSAVLEFFAALGVAGVALYIGLSFLGLVHLRTSPLSLEAGLFCLLMAPEVYQPLRLLAAHYHDRAAAKAALRQIEATMGPLPAGIAVPIVTATTLGPRQQAAGLRITGLTVSTPAGSPVVSCDDFEVTPGSRIALLGPSGIGKSTVLEMLARLRPYRGSIEIDSEELGAIDEYRLRRTIALIGQRPRIVVGSIADNIRLGRPDACETAVRAAARAALVTDFADSLPRGLDTAIGENGIGLSGGEVQRIALARLYLRDPALILLDEPTAHLDAATEAAVLDNLIAFARGRTLIVATHSLAVAARMDRVYRIAGGQILPTMRPTGHFATRARGAA
jgi:ATP-binding cassette subfamily C protein CydD